ncbi:MAG: hypothetical protein JJD98_11500 [Polaromonas sp.]|nr:hypothetical protein [Polaromonas sp.]
MKLHLQTTIWTLLKAGSTQRQIERATGISRHTIRAYKKKFDSQRPDSSADQIPKSQGGITKKGSQNQPDQRVDNLAVLPGAVWVAISGAVWGGHRGPHEILSAIPLFVCVPTLQRRRSVKWAALQA